MKRFSISFITILLFSINFLFAKDLNTHFSDFDVYQKTLSHAEVESKLQKMLIKDEEVYDFIRLDDQALHIYASKKDKEKHNPEFSLQFGRELKPHKQNYITNIQSKPLMGLRVAIDPGHIGGEFSKLEQRYIEMEPNEQNQLKEKAFFNEGTLSTITAKKIAQRVEELGGETFLTRHRPGQVALAKDFYMWMYEDFPLVVDQLTADFEPAKIIKEKNWWQNQAEPFEIFRSTYNFLEIEKRAEIINNFNPDVTISCHYNLGGIYDDRGLNPGTQDDHMLFFVAGAFKRGHLRDEGIRKSSLKSPDSRYEFVRLLVTNDIEESIKLAQIGLKHAKKTLNIRTGDDQNYHKVLCLKQSDGIYHRNLMLSRLVHSPIIYFEPLCQDNFQNVKILAEEPDIIIDKVVDIHIKTLLDWVDCS